MSGWGLLCPVSSILFRVFSLVFVAFSFKTFEWHGGGHFCLRSSSELAQGLELRRSARRFGRAAFKRAGNTDDQRIERTRDKPKPYYSAAFLANASITRCFASVPVVGCDAPNQNLKRKVDGATGRRQHHGCACLGVPENQQLGGPHSLFGPPPVEGPLMKCDDKMKCLSVDFGLESERRTWNLF